MKLNILLCDTFPGLLPSYIESYASMFFNLFGSVRPDMEYKIYNIQEGEIPEEIHTDELYLIPGSRAGAYEEIEWVKNLLNFIRKAHASQAKMIGICFGHQAIAQALGGQVEKSDKGWGTGIRSSKIILPEALNYFPDEIMSMHYNHHDQVVTLPKEATLFASSEFCPNDGFVVGKHILTFQGHPEYTPEYNRYVILSRGQNEPQEIKDKAMQSIESLTAMGQEAARWMTDLISQQ